MEVAMNVKIEISEDAVTETAMTIFKAIERGTERMITFKMTEKEIGKMIISRMIDRETERMIRKVMTD
jgi:hypothetical protein